VGGCFMGDCFCHFQCHFHPPEFCIAIISISSRPAGQLAHIFAGIVQRLESRTPFAEKKHAFCLVGWDIRWNSDSSPEDLYVTFMQ
jgi:hypothetical protein